MATYQHGINGPFKGKVGTVVGSSWQGVPYMKSLYSKKTSASFSTKQKNQQYNFRIMSSFIRGMKSVIQFGFDNHLKGRSLFTKAMSYALKNAMDTTTTPGTINYSRILVTRGKYPNATGLTAVFGTKGNIIFKWTDNSGVGAAKKDDLVILAAYSPLQKRTVCINSGKVRSAGTAELNASEFKGQTVETWASFRRADGTDVSTSVYTGQVVCI